MNRYNQLIPVFAAIFTLAWTSSASAAEPKFTHSSEEELSKLKEVKEVEWKASGLAGMILTTGNSSTTTMSMGAKASRKADGNKFQLELSGAFARSGIYLADDANNDGAIGEGEYERQTQTTARSLEGKARYDRFLSDKDALYISALGLTNKPAGKQLVAGAQLGYSRTLVDSDRHNIVAEVGYDISYENPVVGDGFANHSIRAFAGYEGTLSADSGLNASLESLFNVNQAGPADRFEDARVIGKLALTTKLYEDISFRFGFESRFDNVPSALPAFSTPFVTGLSPSAEKLDTKTEATLIINFL